jgi:hypothetical protein
MRQHSGMAARRGTGRKLQRFNRMILATDLTCVVEGCNQPAAEVDHDQPLLERPDGASPYDPSTAFGKCRHHHLEATRKLRSSTPCPSHRAGTGGRRGNPSSPRLPAPTESGWAQQCGTPRSKGQRSSIMPTARGTSCLAASADERDLAARMERAAAAVAPLPPDRGAALSALLPHDF